jgi:hypothetical protein
VGTANGHARVVGEGVSLEVIVNLIASTTTTTGLKVYAQGDDRAYEKGVKGSDEQLATVNIARNTFHGDRITPSPHHTVSREPLGL